MTNKFSRSQMLKAAGIFVAGAAAAKTLPLISDSPAQAQGVGRIINSNLVVTGDVGIGTTSPSARLDIFSPGNDAIKITNTTLLKAARMGVDSVGVWIEPSEYNSSIRLNANPTLVGIYVRGTDGNIGIGTRSPSQKLDVIGNIQLTGTVIQGSSRELKENIAELSTKEALETLADLSPVKFKYKADTEKAHHIGFIAEDVPELVATPDRKGLSSMDVVGILTKVVQEQQQTILALAEKVKALEEQKV
ncbi:tail fiber domain-containing protein [Nostoc sp. CHAB 5715]|uniref:tail fiber domain-containing protein n=1 Tax=Nostoc sp. CHAB 5715 TaxID=2780400 RepID=UPI001E34CF98|nr:tail fiber domain-containing protein [Nostoc sp. CHAB 5715]MCC5625751.1 tail fiber domain-containing protein [Nostoc sp. CHAB 5715]